MISFEEAKARLETAGQSHVLQFWAELFADERTALLELISQLEPNDLIEHCRAAVAAASRHSSADGRLDARMEPVAPEFIGSVRKSDKETLQMWNDEGTAATNDFCALSKISDVICVYYFIQRCFQGCCRFHRTEWLFCCWLVVRGLDLGCHIPKECTMLGFLVEKHCTRSRLSAFRRCKSWPM